MRCSACASGRWVPSLSTPVQPMLSARALNPSAVLCGLCGHPQAAGEGVLGACFEWYAMTSRPLRLSEVMARPQALEAALHHRLPFGVGHTPHVTGEGAVIHVVDVEAIGGLRVVRSLHAASTQRRTLGLPRGALRWIRPDGGSHPVAAPTITSQGHREIVRGVDPDQS